MNISQEGNEFFTMSSAASLSGGIDGSIEVKLARRLLGQNIFDITDWAMYGIKFSKKQRQVAEKFPRNEDVLNSPCHFNKGKLVKDTHFAFLGIESIKGEPLTVAKWIKMHPGLFYFKKNPKHAGQTHIDEATLTFRWYLLLRDIVPDSTYRTPEEQEAMLPPEYEVPPTIAEVTKDILVFRKTGICPNPSRWAACRDRTVKTDKLPANYVTCVGDFSEGGGLSVSYWNGVGDFFIGVAASRKII